MSQHPVVVSIRESLERVRTETGETYRDLDRCLGLQAGSVSRRQRAVCPWQVEELARLAEHWSIDYDLLSRPTKAVAAVPKKRVSELRQEKAQELRRVTQARGTTRAARTQNPEAA